VEADRTSFDREVFALAGGEAMLSRFRVPWFAMIAAAADGRWDDALEATAELARRFPSYAVARYAHIATESEAGLDRNEDFQAALRAFDEFADGLLLNSGLIALAHRLAGEVSRAAAGLAVDESLVEEALDRLDTAIAFGALVSAASELIGALHRPDWARRLVGFVADRPGEMLTSGYGFRISPADLAHAQLALALDDAGAAVSYAEQAIEVSERFGARRLAVVSRYWLARALHTRHEPADASRAVKVLETACATATTLGLRAQLRRCETALGVTR
jgi:hypothetical protein